MMRVQIALVLKLIFYIMWKSCFIINKQTILLCADIKNEDLPSI